MKRALNKATIVMALTVIIILSGAYAGAWWWAFVLPVLAAGIWLGTEGWRSSALFIGFVSGFLSWAGMSLYFHFAFHGLIFAKFTLAARCLLFILAGSAGGILASLALVTGKMLGLTWRIARKKS